jgi:ELWxxDGT repeat protein
MDAGPPEEHCPPPVDWAKVNSATQLGTLTQPYSMVVNGCTAFINAMPLMDGTKELWRSDGTDKGTFQLGLLEPSFEMKFPYTLNGALIFQSDSDIWRTDGTEAGTQHLFSGASTPPTATALLDEWKLDDSRKGAVVGGTLVFTARDVMGEFPFQTSEQGNELWSSDGSEKGTKLLKDLLPDEGGTAPGPSDYFTVGKSRYFWAEIPNDGSFLSTNRPALFRTDGTAAGTQAVAEISASRSLGDGAATAIALGNQLIFLGTTKDASGIYSSDGTAAGTTLLAALDAPPPGGTSSFSGDASFHLARVGEQVYLYATNLTWAFEGAMGASGPPVDALWVTDGTKTGTHLVVELPHLGYSSQYGLPGTLTVLDDAVYFWTIDDSSTPVSVLYGSRGTAATTAPVAFSAGPPGQPVAMNGALYFRAYTAETGSELWRTLGTTATTALVRDIFPGPSPSGDQDLFVSDGHLFFAADDGVHGSEPWISDGTSAGTRLAADVVEGPDGSKPQRFHRLGGTVIFTANDQAYRF